MSTVIDLDDTTTLPAITAEGPTLLYFRADWCQPCKTLKPHLETIAAERAGALKIVAIDCDAFQPLAAQHGITGGLPQMILLKDGVPVSQFGNGPKRIIDQKLNEHLA